MSKSHIDIWREATPLADAAQELAHPEQWARLDAPMPTLEFPANGDVIVALGSFSTWTSLLAERDAYVREIQRDMHDEICGGDLIAIGFLTSSQHRDSPEIISPDFFHDAKIAWANSSVETLGRRYEGVRIIPAHFVEPTLGEARRPGRPSKSDEIGRVIQTLHLDQPDLGTIDRKTACQLVREHAESQHNANTKIGYSDPVILRALIGKYGILK